MNTSSVLSVELLVVAFVVVALCLFGQRMKLVHIWKAEHLWELAGKIGVSGFLGLVLSYLFSFNGADAGYGLASSALFMVWLLPFVLHDFVAEWPSDKLYWQEKATKASALRSLLVLAFSLVLLSGGVYFGALNSSWSSSAGSITLVMLAVVAAAVIWLSAHFEKVSEELWG